MKHDEVDTKRPGHRSCRAAGAGPGAPGKPGGRRGGESRSRRRARTTSSRPARWLWQAGAPGDLEAPEEEQQDSDSPPAAGTPLIWKMRHYKDHFPEESGASVLMKAEV